MAMIWTDSLATGSPEIDKQHRELIERINRLLEAMKTGKSKDELKPTLDFLGQYVVSHFATEEKRMRETAYPERREHEKLHQDFVAEYRKLAARLQSEGATASLAIEVQQKVCDWLLRHIGQVDRKLGAHLRAQTRTAS